MLQLDTNIFIRFFIDDDPQQSIKVRKLFSSARENSLGLLLTVVLESEWVLRSVYDFNAEEVISLFRDALTISQLKIEHPDTLRRALDLYQNGKANFADALHTAQALRLGQEILTFDKNATSVGMRVMT